MARLFNLNQDVRLKPTSALAHLSCDGVYEIIRLMPADVAGNFSYRLRSSAGERVALEHDLAPNASL